MRTVIERSKASKPCSLQILESLRKAECDEAINERRSTERTPFVHPVHISLGRDIKTEIQATSKNLSRTGICLIHDVELRVGRIGELTIYCPDGDFVQVRADVRWCQTYCGSWFISGWRFSADQGSLHR